MSEAKKPTTAMDIEVGGVEPKKNTDGDDEQVVFDLASLFLINITACACMLFRRVCGAHDGAPF